MAGPVGTPGTPGTPQRDDAHVLIADDEPGTTALIADMLRYAGLRVTTASDGTEALARMREAAPDVAFLDVMMPGLDGCALCRRVRADAALADIRIVLHSSADECDVDWRGAGADGFLQKPFPLRELPGLLRSYARRTRS